MQGSKGRTMKQYLFLIALVFCGMATHASYFPFSGDPRSNPNHVDARIARMELERAMRKTRELFARVEADLAARKAEQELQGQQELEESKSDSSSAVSKPVVTVLEQLAKKHSK
jgi:hypothetical protein